MALSNKPAKELLNWVVEQLTTLYSPAEAQSIAFILLEEQCGMSRNQIIINDIASYHKQELIDIISRLVTHEPIQYVLGKASFYDLEFIVNPAVLIPRPETEELVHHIIQKHKSRQQLRILDIGTGSGCIPITLQKNLPNANVFAIDISHEALTTAKRNAEMIQANVEFHQKDILKDNLEPITQLDIIISNPPYVRELEKQYMRENVLAFEPHLALFVPDSNPLLFYERIAHLAFTSLNRSGWLYFEINEAYGNACKNMVMDIGFEKVNIIKDMQGKDRILEAIKM